MPDAALSPTHGLAHSVLAGLSWEAGTVSSSPYNTDEETEAQAHRLQTQGQALKPGGQAHAAKHNVVAVPLSHRPLPGTEMQHHSLPDPKALFSK